jgi:hypothetical protein
MLSLALLQARMLKEKQEMELELRSGKEELSRLRAQVARNRFLEDDGRQQMRHYLLELLSLRSQVAPNLQLGSLGSVKDADTLVILRHLVASAQEEAKSQRRQAQGKRAGGLASQDAAVEVQHEVRRREVWVAGVETQGSGRWSPPPPSAAFV